MKLMNVNKLVWKFTNLMNSLIQLKNLFQQEDMVLHLNNLILLENQKKMQFLILKNTKKINKRLKMIMLPLLLKVPLLHQVVKVEMLHNQLLELLIPLSLNFKLQNAQSLKKVKPLKSTAQEKLLNLNQLYMDNQFLTVIGQQEDYYKKMLKIKFLIVLDKLLALLKLVMT